MKHILLLLFISFLSFSQENFCDKSVEFSNLYYKSDYQNLLNKLQDFKTTNIEFNTVLNFNIARLSFYLKEYDKAQTILIEVLNSKNEISTIYFECDRPIFLGDYQVENIFNTSQLKESFQLLLSDVYYEKGEYEKALESLLKTIKIVRKTIYYGCGNAVRRDILQFEHRKFDILTKLNRIEEANQSGFSVLFLTFYESLINELKNNLLRKYSKKEIRNEFKSQIKNIKIGVVNIGGNEINTTYINFFNYKIIIWDEIKNNQDAYLKNQIAFTLFTK